MSKKITKNNILDYLIFEKDNEYHFKFPNIPNKLIVKLSGHMLHFRNDKKIGEGITNAILEEVRSEAVKSYEIHRRNNSSSEQVS